MILLQPGWLKSALDWALWILEEDLMVGFIVWCVLFVGALALASKTQNRAVGVLTVIVGTVAAAFAVWTGIPLFHGGFVEVGAKIAGVVGAAIVAVIVLSVLAQSKDVPLPRVANTR